MSFEFKCPQCGQRLMADESDRGKVVECPYCHKGIVVPCVKPKPGIARSAGVGEETKHPQSKSWPRIILAIFLYALVAVAMLGAISYGGYLYFGDAPRLERGIAHYEKKEYSKAFKLLLPLAEKGYARAQFYVGDCYANGNGVIKDMEEAVKWHKSAADMDIAEAQHRMYRYCLVGIGMDKSVSNAAKWCRKAADAGIEEAMYDMGMLYIAGKGVEENAKSAYRWFRRGAECGYPPALYQFGLCYKLGIGIEKDEDQASRWQNKAVGKWRNSANAGEAASMILLGICYRDGDVVELDKEKAAKWFRKAAETGDALAQLILAICYYTGDGVDQDVEEAAKWMLKSAVQETLQFQFIVSDYYYRELKELFGELEMPDENELRTLAGFAQLVMGHFYQRGQGVAENKGEAIKWFERSSKRGCTLAKICLARCYWHGDGVQVDKAKAEELLKEAAAYGNKEAKRILDKILRERAEKESKISELLKIENGIEERKKRINKILRGEYGGDWKDFDATKIKMTDGNISVEDEPPSPKVIQGFYENNSIEEIDGFIFTAQKEVRRLDERLKDLFRVRKLYAEKELESRKETCKLCGGVGLVACARCKGKGEVINKERVLCPTCDGDKHGFVYVTCDRCRGTGRLRLKCSTCKGKGRIDIQFKLSRERCGSCNGTGRGRDIECPKCLARGEVRVDKMCVTCSGQGEVVRANKYTCSVCDGKGRLRCDSCNERGFIYRPKEGKTGDEKK